jgi:nitrite reductase/ring-hydroxylating ferredoxin subunit
MAKSLKPTTTGHPTPDPHSPATEPQRRGFLAGIAALAIGGIVGLVPMGAGLLVFLDPIFKKRAKAGGAEGGEEDSRPFLRVAAVDALPPDGTPVQVPVIADLTDAWNREPNQPVGAVYLRKTAAGVECFNAICPHAGCFVGYAADRKVFQCPCHTSSFQLDGSRIMPSPSPRDMDPQKVDEEKLKQNGEVWVQFVNYYPGHAEREAKP